MKKTLAIMLALIMVLALVPTVAFAAGNTIYVDAYKGKGISNHLDVVFKYEGSQVGSGSGKVYILQNYQLTGNASNNADKANPGIIIKDGIAYKFSHAGIGLNLKKLKYFYYNSSDDKWYYNYLSSKVDIVFREGRINFVYEETGNNTYTLNYDENGGEDAPKSATQVKKSLASATFTISSEKPFRNGYNFLGWADTKDGTVKYKAGEDLTLTYTSEVTEKTIYAVWEKIQPPVTIDITYNGNAGNDAVSNLPDPTTSTIPNGQYDAPFTISDKVPTRNDYGFLGWADRADAAEPQYQPGSTIDVSGDKCFYAVWEKEVLPPEPVKLIGDITVKCVTATDNHGEKQTTLIGGSYTVSPIVNNRATVKIKSEEYVKFYNDQVTGVTHTITGDTEKTINIEYDDEQKTWVVVGENATPVVFTVQHEPVGGSGFVKVKKEFKGLPNGTFPNEALFKVKQGDEEIANIYVNQNNDWGANKTTQLLPGDYTVEEIINSEVQVEGYILTAPEAQDFTIVAGQITEVTFTNEYVEEPFPGVITVKKTVESNDPADKEFNFKVTVITDPNSDPSGPPIAKSANAVKAPAARGVDKTATNKDFKRENNRDWTFYFTLKDGDTMTISNLPVGFIYRVEELDAAGYTVTVNNEPTSSKDVGLTKEKPEMTLEFKNTKGSTPTPTPTPYNGGGGHYHPTTTPVPVIVIPPKTGDMTVWQSILHFLGIR